MLHFGMSLNVIGIGGFFFACYLFVHAAQLWVRKWQKMRSFAGGGHYSRGTIFEMKLMQHITADGVSIIL
jgi:hypothetical protein